MSDPPESTPLLASDTDQNTLEQGQSESEKQTWREWMAKKLEAPATHKVIIALIAIDACCVLADLSYTFLSPSRECDCPSASLSSLFVQDEPADPDADPKWLTILSHLSLAITTLFLLEIPLALWAFGPQFYNPFPGSRRSGTQPYAGLHLFDALVVLTTFVLEVILRGREAELAGLLVLLRLWRLVKLVGGIAVGAGELQEELSNKLEETERLLHSERARSQQLEDENAHLRARLSRMDT